MTVTSLRWKERSLYPYTCAGCKTKHEKGEGVYLDQSGPRTVTYDTPQCAETVPRRVTLEATSKKLSLTPAPAVTPLPVSTCRAQLDQLTLSMHLHGKSVDVILRGEGVEKVTLDRLVQDLSRLMSENLS